MMALKWKKSIVRQEKDKFKRKLEPKINKKLEKARKNENQQKLL
jgi:hypothetical protein